MSRLKWLLLIFYRYYRNLGLRVSLYALLSLVATMIGPLASSYLGSNIADRMSFSSVLPVLTILATSMLAVSTFSLNIMVTAHRAAAATTTPRVHRILLENTTTQSVLAAFIGAFVYSLASIVLYRTGFYADESAIVVMATTVLVVAVVVVSMLRWIQHLTTLGSVDDSLRSARIRARDVLMNLAHDPGFGANELTDETVLPTATAPVRAHVSGYLQLVDAARIQGCLGTQSFAYVDACPGQHFLKGEVLAHVSGPTTEQMISQIELAFTFGEERTHEQDATFGLIVLSEIAGKALSPGVNDPGTAIAAILSLKEVLWDYLLERPENPVPDAPNVFVRAPKAPALIDAAFASIARDGAGTIEVALQLRQTLAALSSPDYPEMADAAREMAKRAMLHSERAGLLDDDMGQLNTVAV